MDEEGIEPSFAECKTAVLPLNDKPLYRTYSSFILHPSSFKKHPRQELNLRLHLRRVLLFPLSYGDKILVAPSESHDSKAKRIVAPG